MNNTLIDVVSPPYSVLTLQEIALNSLGAKDNNKYDKFISYNASQQIEKRKIIEFIKGDYYEKIALFTHYYYINSYVNDIEKMRLVIKYYPNFINSKTKLEGDTALHEAVIIGSESLVKLLIQNIALTHNFNSIFFNDFIYFCKRSISSLNRSKVINN